MVRLLVVAGAAAVAVAGGTASAASRAFAYDRELAVVAATTLRAAVRGETARERVVVRRVGVRCYRSRDSFERSFRMRFDASASRVIAYYAGGSDVHLRSATCASVRAFLDGRHTIFTAAAFSILLHESLHRQGIRDERVTTCYANEAVRWGALSHGFPDARAIRARSLAFDYTRTYSPRSYFLGRPTCLAIARRASWPEHVERRRG